jgi:hypothetical protein
MSGATGIGVNDIGVDVAGNNTHSQGSEVQNVMTIANGLIGEVAQPRSEVIDNTIETFMTKALELINQIIEPMPHGFTKEDLLRLILNHAVELKEPYSTIDRIMEAARKLAIEITEQPPPDDNGNTVDRIMEAAQKLAIEITKQSESLDNDNTVDKTMEAAQKLAIEITKQPESLDNDNTVDKTMEAAQKLAIEITKQPESLDNDNTVDKTMEAAQKLAIEITKQPDLVLDTDTDNVIDKTLQQSVDLLKRILSPEEVIKPGMPWFGKFNIPEFFKDRAGGDIDINEYYKDLTDPNKRNTHISKDKIMVGNDPINPAHVWWGPPPLTKTT